MLSWSQSPALEAILRALEDAQRAIEEVKRYLDERLTPFQKYLADQGRSVDQTLRQLEGRIRPLKQYLQGQEQNLERVSTHLDSELKTQFDDFTRYLGEQRRILADAGRYLEEQPKPYRTYLDGQQGTVEMIYQDVVKKLTPFTEHLREQQRILERIAQSDVLEEFRALKEYMMERQRALEKFSATPDLQPDEYFRETDDLARKYRNVGEGRYTLLAQILERCRAADEALRHSLQPAAAPVGAAVTEVTRAAG